MSNEQSAESHGQAKSSKQLSVAHYAWVAVLAALVGFAAVYVTFGPSDNGAREKTMSDASGSSAPVAGATSKNSKPVTKSRMSLSSGQMATFVFKKTPQALPEVSFTDGAGKAKSLKDWRGKIVLLNLWATWCAPCRREMPDLDKLQGALGSDDFEVLAISVDRKGLPASKRFLDQIKIANLGLYNDATARMTGKLKVVGMPTTLLLDRTGKEIGRLVGPAEWNGEDARRLIKAQF